MADIHFVAGTGETVLDIYGSEDTFFIDVVDASLKFKRNADNLEIDYTDTDKIVLTDFFAAGHVDIETVFDTIKVLNSEEGYNIYSLMDKLIDVTVDEGVPYTGVDIYDGMFVVSGYNENITGTDSDDTIDGSYGDDYIYGNKGEDILYGHDGEDIIYGGDDADYIEGGNGNDELYGEAGNDEIYGDGGNDLIYGGTGADIIDGGEDNDEIHGDEDCDVIYGNDGFDKLYGDAGNDEIHGGNHDDSIYGGIGNDEIYGDEGRDVIYGGAGEDTIYGGDHDDEIHGDTDNDILTGGYGSDTFIFNAGDGVDIITDAENSDGIIINVEDAQLTFSRNTNNDLEITYTNNDKIILQNYFAVEYVHTETVFDTIKVLKKSGGYTTYSIRNQIINAAAQNDVDFVGVDIKTDDIIVGGFKEKITGTTSADTIYSRSGDDELHGGAGNDKLYGDSGNDLIFGDGDGDTIYGDTGEDIIYGGEGEDTIYGGDNDDEIHGGTDNDTLTGGNGSDTFVFNAGDGVDTINDAQSGDVIKINVEDAELTFTRKENNDLEIGYTENDKIILKNFFSGEYLHTETVFDTIKVLNSETGEYDTISLKEQLINANVVYDNNFIGVDIKTEGIVTDGYNEKITGTDGNDTIYGNSGNDEIHGGAGEDTIYGGKGDDKIYGDANNDILTGGDGDNTYVFKAGDGIDNITDIKKGDIIQIDVADAELTFTRNTDNDLVIAYTEDDKIILNEFFAGDVDTETVFDTIKVLNSETSEYDNVSLREQVIDATVKKDVIFYGRNIRENGVITDGYKENVIGTQFADTIYGNYGDDVIDGGAGDDEIFGGNGDDIIYGGTGTNEIHGGDGEDEIYGGTGNDVIYGDDGKDEIRGDEGNDEIFGGDGEDVIYGGDGNDIISGGNDNDEIFGGEGNDTISGDAGDDNLTGGNGNNTFVFNTGDDSDVITDIKKSDIIRIDVEDAEPTFTRNADNDLEISYTENDKIILKNFFSGEYLHTETVFDTIKVLNSETGEYDIMYLKNQVINASVTEGETFYGVDIKNGEEIVGGYKENITGTAESDTIYGNFGDDVIHGGAGDDELHGGDDDDLIYGDAGDDEIFGDNGSDDIFGDEGDDEIYGGEGDDEIYGGDGNDTIYGDEDNDVIFGDDGDDDIFGGEGDDLIYGDDGEDEIHCGEGNDKIYGGKDDDLIFAGEGNNTFVFETGDGEDTIFNATNNDIAQFKSIEFDSLKFTRTDDDLVITNLTDSITISDFFNTESKLNTIQILDSEEVITENKTILEDAWINVTISNDYTSTIYKEIIKPTESCTISNLSGYDKLDFSGTSFETLNFLRNKNNLIIINGKKETTIKDYFTNVGELKDVVIITSDETPYTLGDADFVEYVDTDFENITFKREGNNLLISYGETVSERENFFGVANYDTLLTLDEGTRVSHSILEEGTIYVSDVSTYTGYDVAPDTGYLENIAVGYQNNVSYDIEDEIITTHYDETGAYKSAILGNCNDDIICGSTKSDWLNGGEGKDVIYSGSAGNDVLLGKNGEDKLVGGALNIDGSITYSNSNITFYGGADADIIIGGNGDDTIFGDKGDDTLTGNKGSNIYVFADTTGFGTDNITDTSQNDTLKFALEDLSGFKKSELKFTQEGKNLVVKAQKGGEIKGTVVINNYYNTIEKYQINNLIVLSEDGTHLENTQIVAPPEIDVYINPGDSPKYKGSNEDQGISAENYFPPKGLTGVTITTGTGRNTVIGSKYNDTINASKAKSLNATEIAGTNKITSGKGADTILLDGTSSNTVSAGAGKNKIEITSSGKNKVTAGNDGNTIYTENGINTIKAGNGANTVNLNGGTNTLITGKSNDSIQITDGKNTVKSGSGNDKIIINSGINNINTGSGQSTVFVYGGNNTLISGSNIDTYTVSGGKNNIKTGAGNDNITITDGNNTIDTGSGNDVVKINGGTLTINGGAGDDNFYINDNDGKLAITGGAGKDTYDMSSYENILLTNNIIVNDSSGANILKLSNDYTKNDLSIYVDITLNKKKAPVLNGEWKLTQKGITEAEDISGVDFTGGTKSSMKLTVHGGYYMVDKHTLKEIATDVANWMANNTGFTSTDALIQKGSEVEVAGLLAQFDAASAKYVFNIK